MAITWYSDPTRRDPGIVDLARDLDRPLTPARDAKATTGVRVQPRILVSGSKAVDPIEEIKVNIVPSGKPEGAGLTVTIPLWGEPAGKGRNLVRDFHRIQRLATAGDDLTVYVAQRGAQRVGGALAGRIGADTVRAGVASDTSEKLEDIALEQLYGKFLRRKKPESDMNKRVAEVFRKVGNAAIAVLESSSSYWPVQTGLSKFSFTWGAQPGRVVIGNRTNYARYVEDGRSSAGYAPCARTLSRNIGKIARMAAK